MTQTNKNKRNSDLSSADIFISQRRLLSKDEKFAVEWWFKQIYESTNLVPPNIEEDMINIETQYKEDGKLSEAQLKYVQEVYEQYS